jgi:hypothetical protein
VTGAAQRPAVRQRKSLRRTRRYLARFSLAALTGAGHVYSTLDGASAWASIIPPPGWTPERTAALARQPAG